MNQICLTRVTLNSLLRLTNLWPSDSGSNWNLEMLVFEERERPEYLQKNPRSKDENQEQTQPTFDAESGNQTRATLVGGEHSHYCITPAPPFSLRETLKDSTQLFVCHSESTRSCKVLLTNQKKLTFLNQSRAKESQSGIGVIVFSRS